MATFPSAAAQFQGQQEQNNPLNQYGKVVSLQNAMQEQQLRQQLAPMQIQQAQNTLQQQNMELQSTKAIQQAFMNHPTDTNAMLEEARANGALPQHLSAYQNMDIERQKNLALKTKAELDNMTTQADNASSALDSVRNAKPEDQPMLYKQLQASVQADPQAATRYGSSAVNHILQTPYESPQQLDLFSATISNHKSALDAAKTQEAQAQTAKAKAETAQLQPFTPEKVAQINQGLAQLARTVYPSVPGWAQLGPDATMKDFERIDKLLGTSVTAQGNQAQRDTANAIRGQTMQLAKQAADETNYQHAVTQLNTVGKPVTDLMGRFGRLQDTIAQGTPQADALVAPELLTIMAGGQGSGLRMNEAEIARIVGGRSEWQNLQASIQQWSTNPETANSITPDQRQQIKALVKTVGEKLSAKEQAIQSAHQQLLGTSDPNERRSIVGKAQQAITDIDTKPQGGGQQNPTTGVPQGATGIAPGSDGKRYYHDAQGKILGVAP